MIIRESFEYIPGYDNYLVGDMGSVVNARTGRYLKPSMHTRGYAQVGLSKNSMVSTRLIHVMVAEAFLDDWRPGLYVRHRNEDLWDNRASNLVVVGGERRPLVPVLGNRYGGKAVRIKETGEVFRNAYDCARYIGGDASNIYAILRGGSGRHLGYSFEYVEE